MQYTCNIYNAIYIYMQYIYIHIYTFLVKYCYCAISNAANIHIPYEILLFRTLECKKYTFSLWNINILHSRMLEIYIILMKYCYFAISNARNIHFPYEIITFWYDRCAPGCRREAARKPFRPGPSRVQKIV